MKQTLFITNDGSTSIRLDELDETYHSKHGAIQEAYHVFIKNGLSLFEGRSVSVLEIGFGTGLNALITLKEAQNLKQTIDYVGIEAHPVSFDMIMQMNYVQQLDQDNLKSSFELMHHSDWQKRIAITPNFSLIKEKKLFQEINNENQFDLIYFDAFGFRVQPELWSVEIFQKMYKALKKDGVLVTYACRTSIKNAMKECGFTVEKLPGAPGKREMLRAFKI
ncbi:tRNA (5-methylaminomethyl-2-thiouridine)(34)-methyltransferase MnmD [Flavobacterium sp.]|uniref:tRNA (5-methylaminomethyl-2-thiouridine)(34)-methyltransferase MnmD n=1 Tax=Flavobacterium sp. TaxID=239 RepID=UPI002B4AC13A|nr:tRNA (5-methylaminomethyl-2-thiouridine)(34)-methyltransferase MnmD [Flavobacterium sp.]HLP64871.1 tRNA (5-methylaminomethyl-2-thiouridine)(34)-methyltransferase MnmD [Flavobacterium sp.]